MSGQVNFKKPLIIDSPTLVSKTQHFTEWSIHILGWIAWMLLIRPLIILIIWYVAYRFFNYQMFTLEGIENPEYFGIGAAVLAVIYLAMLGWSRYNAWRFRGKDRRRSRGQATVLGMSRYYKILPDDLSSIQESSNIDVYFLDNEIVEVDNGKKRIKALYAPQNPARHHEENIEFDNKALGVRSFRETFKMLDPYTRGHSIRISQMSTILARQMGIKDRKELRNIRLGGICHDIGKILIPSSILEKPAPLTEKEFAIIKKHPELSIKILQSIPINEDVSKIILYHHEFWDGSGYPSGLKGPEIPLGARICSLADTFDAMRTDRVYSRKKPLDYVVEEINRFSGIKFDPAVVEAFRKCSVELDKIAEEKECQSE